MIDRKPTKGRVIVLGIAFWYPLAGVTYQMLHYLLGLRALGHDVFYVEELMGEVYDPAEGAFTYDYANNLRLIGPRLDGHGFAGRWACRDGDGVWHGMTGGQVADLYRSADALLNVCGSHHLTDEQMVVPARLFCESDPFSVQVRVAKGDEGTRKFLDAHTHHFTFGENIGRPGCLIPDTGHHWQPTRQPVHLPLWASEPVGGDTYNTITTWQNKGEPIEWAGEHYWWTKDREFRKVLDLPRRLLGQRFELATGVDDDVRDLLLWHGWQLADSHAVSIDPVVYADYIKRSRGEFTVARDQYSRPRTGWFSDRTACYLAAGRPVMTGDTAFDVALPTGRGLFGFHDVDGAAAAVEAIETDYAGHCAAAREIAAEYFAADKVLGGVMSRAGVG
jgi:hypothetical protein